MKIAPLGSGSAGNSYYIESEGTSILVDAGFGPRETEKRLRLVGASLASVSAILITHEHYDHIRGAAKVSAKAGAAVHMTAGTLRASSLDPEETVIQLFENDTSFEIGDLLVHARRTSHDASDPVSYVVESREGARIGIASDLGAVDASILEHLSGCDALFFEANHDLDMLRSGTYPWSLKRRIMSRYGHLSNDDSMTALERIVGEDLQKLCLIHLSQKNNHESIVESMALGLLDRLGVRPELRIARQEGPLEPVEVVRGKRPAPRPAAFGQLALF
ncbi:MAG: MBL fold metallo-hydrolase [Thermoanaerobaculia bacterium]